MTKDETKQLKKSKKKIPGFRLQTQTTERFTSSVYTKGKSRFFRRADETQCSYPRLAAQGWAGVNFQWQVKLLNTEEKQSKKSPQQILKQTVKY